MAWNPLAAGSTSQSDNQLSPDPQTVASVVPSAARTTSGTSAAVSVPEFATYANVLVDVTAASGTTPTLVNTVQWSHDGTTWFTADPTAETFTQVTAAGKVVKQFPVKSPWFRLSWTIGGTTPSFTFAAHVDYR